MTGDEVDSLVNFIAENPQAGEKIPGTGGCRKVRFAQLRRGKSGGYRTITFFTGKQMPVFLVTVFSKGEKIDLSREEAHKLKKVTKQIVAEYREKVVSVRDIEKGA